MLYPRLPELPELPGHALAAQQIAGFNRIFSARFRAGEAVARLSAESTRLCALSVSLGELESLVCYCSGVTHASVRGTALAVPTDLVRLSVRVEDLADLREHLAAAPRTVRAATESAVALHV